MWSNIPQQQPKEKVHLIVMWQCAYNAYDYISKRKISYTEISTA